MSAPLALARFQESAVDALAGVLQKVSRLHEAQPEARRELALESGVSLLQSPTGSGKTLVLSRVLEAAKGSLDRPTVWLWFAPYSGLVGQTRSALEKHAPSLRVRDIAKDREAVGSRDGDVFIQTWQAVAANNKDARKVRRRTEDTLSLDDLIAHWRAENFFIGVVIDEAHLNFGANATVAAEFYLNTLCPDFTILATATPNDAKLDEFEKKAQIKVASRITVARREVVEAGLNKPGLRLGVLSYRAEDRDFIDHETATLTAAWTQHCKIKERLAEREISLTPLLLVQVEDQAKGGNDPVKRVEEKLKEIGIPAEALRTHTSGKPDPDFHTLAYDPQVQVLVFKVSVATGFDAPRAWSLVSVRPNRGKEFGLQIVGRIMRVHPLVRPIHGEDPLLDNGYVFLTDPDMQSGLNAAAQEIEAVRDSINLITDHLDILDLRTGSALGDGGARPARRAAPQSDAERSERMNSLISDGYLPAHLQDRDTATQDRAILHGEEVRAAVQTPLFSGELPKQSAPQNDLFRRVPGGERSEAYRLRTDLDLPKALWREVPPDPSKLGEMVVQIAREFCRDVPLAEFVMRRSAKVALTLSQLFHELAPEYAQHFDVNVQLSPEKIAARAQHAFDFNQTLDVRKLKQALVAEAQRIADERGWGVSSQDLRRTIDLATMLQPQSLKDAINRVNGRYAGVSNAEEIPEIYFDIPNLAPARRGAYGVFPTHLNNEERAFAELLDSDPSGTVRWWLRNPENERWATRLVLPSGKRFFPDFVVGVQGRSTNDGIALVEIKDNGITGRLQSDTNLEKIQVQHRNYREVAWSFRRDEAWMRGEYDGFHNRIIGRRDFVVSDLVYIN